VRQVLLLLLPRRQRHRGKPSWRLKPHESIQRNRRPIALVFDAYLAVVGFQHPPTGGLRKGFIEILKHTMLIFPEGT
jgi:hypothetical protein